MRKLSFFNDLSDSEVWEVLCANAWGNYPANGKIITEGNIDDSFYIIVKDDVTLCKGTTEISSLSATVIVLEKWVISPTHNEALPLLPRTMFHC